MKSIRDLEIAQAGRPIRIVQFGEGNFLRAFVDDMIDVANERGVLDAGVAIVKPIPSGSLEAFREQGNRYTVCLRGKQDGRVVDDRRVITCVRRVVDAYSEYAAFLELAELPELSLVVSNTTEAGIVFEENDRYEKEPPVSFPGKLTKFLHTRWKRFRGDVGKGLVMLPVELIEDNGGRLKECVDGYIRLWGLETAFAAWVEEACTFCSTLVDRIVTGYPREEGSAICAELGYEDRLLDVAEPFGLWVIEDPAGTAAKRLPLDRAGLPVVFTGDQRPYRERKVRILNGAHTATVLAGCLMGKDTVGECMADPLLRRFMETAVLEEIVPTVPLPRAEAEAFARMVFERFENPFVRHALLSISLNSVSKWKARILPSLRDSLAAKGRLPRCLTFSFAALLAFYTGSELGEDVLFGSRAQGECYPIRDTGEVLRFFAKKSGSPDYVRAVCGQTAFWGEDLNRLPGFSETVTNHLGAIRAVGMETALRQAMEG